MQNKIIILFLLFMNSIYAMENQNQLLRIKIKKNLKVLNNTLDFATLIPKDEGDPNYFGLVGNFIRKENKIYEPEELKNKLDKIRDFNSLLFSLNWGLITFANACLYTATPQDDPNLWAMQVCGFSSAFLFVKTFFDKKKHRKASVELIELYQKLKSDRQ